MIDRLTISRIIETAKIEDVVADYVTLKRSGSNLKGLCPFHDEKTGSFMVSPAKGIFKCFGCGKAGNVVSFLMEYEKCSYTEALRMLAKRYHIEIQERELTPEEQQKQNDREAMLLVNAFANSWFQEQMNSQEGQSIALSYFRERGLSDAIIHKFQLGFAPKGNNLLAAARKAGYKEEYLLKTGLCGKSDKNGELYDYFRNRVIYPFHSVSGKPIAFAGRIINMQDHAERKYVNSIESEVYTKGAELFGLYLAKTAIAKQDRCFLVEGQMDVISMHQAGIENVVCSGGTSLTEKQIKLIHRFTPNMTLVFDGDSAGIHAALRGIDLLLKEGMNVKVLLLPDGKDPDQFARENNADVFLDYFNKNQVDFIHFKINVLKKDAGNDPIKKAGMVNQVVESIAHISDTITRRIYMQEAANLFDIDELELASAIEKKYSTFLTEDLQKKKRAEERNALDTTTTATDKSTGIYSKLLQGMILSKEDINLVNIMQTMIRYGKETLYEGENISVAEFILQTFEEDQYKIQNPLFARFFTEYKQHMAEPDFVPTTYFMTIPTDIELTQLVVELISDNEIVSKIYAQSEEKNAEENADNSKYAPNKKKNSRSIAAEEAIRDVPRLLLELKYTIVEERIKDARLFIKEAANDPSKQEQMLSYLQYQMKLEQVKKYLNEQLGR